MRTIIKEVNMIKVSYHDEQYFIEFGVANDIRSYEFCLNLEQLNSLLTQTDEASKVHVNEFAKLFKTLLKD